AMSSYVAAGIADSNQTKTSLIAVKLGLVGFILPFFFLDNPVLLLGATNVGWIISLKAVITACVGTIALAAGLNGYLLNKCNMAERTLLVVSAITMIHPGAFTDIIGIVLFGAILVLQWMKHKNA
ncbi:MAG: DUF3394 domain-containing protein, partial [Peptococcaceae bacterium]|nr:DUF3394 domain-containing protein [Peptococcaceae bacterium]